MLFCCLPVFPTGGSIFYEAPRKTGIRVRFYLDGAQKARRVFERHRLGFTANRQYSVADTFPPYISLPPKPHKNLQENGTR
jgi:hypothetical protein